MTWESNWGSLSGIKKDAPTYSVNAPLKLLMIPILFYLYGSHPYRKEYPISFRFSIFSAIAGLAFLSVWIWMTEMTSHNSLFAIGLIFFVFGAAAPWLVQIFLLFKHEHQMQKKHDGH